MLFSLRASCRAGGAALAMTGILAGFDAARAADLPPSFENIPAGEALERDEIAALTITAQDKRAEQDENQQGQLLRGVHAKAHGCVGAEFTVNGDIEEKYRVGLFSQPGRKYSAWIRFSNASVLREDDLKADDKGIRQHGSRGMAIKVLDVEGEMLGSDDGHSNQDFLMINTLEFAFANVRDYLRLSRILDLSPKSNVATPYFFPAARAQLGEPVDGEPAGVTATRNFLQAAIEADPLLNTLTEDDLKGTIASARIVAKIAGRIVPNPMQVQYFGAAPFLFGAGRAMKFSAAPCAGTEQDDFPAITADTPSANYLSEALKLTMSGKQAVCYDFKIQTRGIDAKGLNIEDATTTWPEEANSYVNVARINIQVPQSPHTPETLEQCEKLAFSPWHALAVHRPLGGINRLRRKVYSNSAGHRAADGY